MKLDFDKVIITDLTGKKIESKLKNVVANVLFSYTKNLSLLELARKIYAAKGPVEMSDQEADQIIDLMERDDIQVMAFGRGAIKDYIVLKKAEEIKQRGEAKAKK